jgi:hypothetical protein
MQGRCFAGAELPARFRIGHPRRDIEGGRHMEIEHAVREAIVQELRRQADNAPDRLKVEDRDGDVLINGQVDLDDLVMVVMGSVAGGP